MKIMKKSIVLLGSVLFVCACAGASKKVTENISPAQYTQLVEKADKSCRTDADCAAVKKGCCLCQGYESVNKSAAADLQNQWNAACAAAPCTLQMCYVEIDPVCKNNVCTGTLKPIESYFAK